MSDQYQPIAHFHLPGLFEFHKFYQRFLPLFHEQRNFFYDWCEIGSIYGAPANCIWNGGRISNGISSPLDVISLMQNFQISARLTFSNSLLQPQHLTDKRCNELCRMFNEYAYVKNGVIVHSDILLEYLKNNFKNLYFVSSTTKVLTNFSELLNELNQPDFQFVVPDFRFNKSFGKLFHLSQSQKDKIEFLCNECCWIGCKDRRECYENVSRQNIGIDCPDFPCSAPNAQEGYLFSAAMANPSFISLDDIKNVYLPNGFGNFKIEGRGLGSAILLEFILYYMAKPEYQLQIREKLYLDSTLDLF